MYKIDFIDSLFENWNTLTNLKNPKSFLRFNIVDRLCISVNDIDIPLYCFESAPGGVLSSVEIESKQVPITLVRFERILLESKTKLRRISDTLTKEIRERFHRDDLLEAMAVVNPNFQNLVSDYNNIGKLFNKHMENIVNHFGKSVEINGVEIKGILDKKALIQ